MSPVFWHAVNGMGRLYVLSLMSLTRPLRTLLQAFYAAVALSAKPHVLLLGILQAGLLVLFFCWALLNFFCIKVLLP